MKKQITALIHQWREQAQESRYEASRIRSVAHANTDAEERCRTRAEVWDNCADQLAAALHAEGAPAPPHEWQPIETVPKDGRMVLVYPASCWTDDTEFDYEVTYWDADFGRLFQRCEPDDFSGYTHWMPLPPAPPKEKA